MSPDTLEVLLAGQVVGRLTRSPGRRLRFRYAEPWREVEDAYPLSLSMPLSAAEHGHRALASFLWNLLPESPLVLDRWARQFQVSASDPFALLAEVGEDCPGAVQFARPERVTALLRAGRPEVQWLDEPGVAARLRMLRTDHAAWRSPTDSGQFSLAGAQPKTALLFDGRRFGVPAGRVPTTHILKPPLQELDGHAENEHLCLALSRALGLPSASTQVRRFEDELAIVVERYDRVRVGRSLLRVHQEDMCQALGVLPSAKYQSEGGPGPHQIIELLRTHGSRAADDVRTFVDALVLSWLIGGTDAHAKNYSVLIGARGQVRLAPLYDVASAYPYARFQPRKLKLAMKIGRTYRIHDIDRRCWSAFAREARLAEDELLARARALAGVLPQQLDAVRAHALRDGLSEVVVDRVTSAIAKHAARCAQRLM